MSEATAVLILIYLALLPGWPLLFSVTACQCLSGHSCDAGRQGGA